MALSAVMSMYASAETVVRTVYRNSKGFKVEFMVAMSSELLYAHDLVVIAETEDDLIKRINEWKDNVESRGMRVNM